MDFTPNFFSRNMAAESTCFDSEIVPNELAVSSISSIDVPSLYKDRVSSVKGASRFSEVSVRMILSQLSWYNKSLTCLQSAGDMLPVIMLILPLGTDGVAKC